MNKRVTIECQKVKTDHMLNWGNSRKKWLATAINKTESNIYISWAEQFISPIDGALWIEEIDESENATAKYIAEPSNITSASFKTFASAERSIAPHKFVQICVPANQTGSWIMERQSINDNWEGFSIYDRSIVKTLRDENQVPQSIGQFEPKITGWFWS